MIKISVLIPKRTQENYIIKRIKLLIFFIIIFTANNSFGNAYFVVAPGVIHLNMKNNSLVESFIVRNTGKEKIRLRLAPVYFPIESKSMKMGIPLKNKVIDDISKNLIVSPRVLSLKPGQRRTVRVAYRKKGPVEPGDYRAHILLKSIDPVKQNVKPDSRAKGITLNLEVKLQTAVAVYLHQGRNNASLDFEAKRDGRGNLIISSINRTKYKYDGWFQIISGNNKSKVDRLLVFRESIRDFAIRGDKIKSLIIKWGVNKESLENEKQFNLK